MKYINSKGIEQNVEDMHTSHIRAALNKCDNEIWEEQDEVMYLRKMNNAKALRLELEKRQSKLLEERFKKGE